MRNESSLTAVQYGVGPIGTRIVETAHDCGFEFVGAIDIDPDKVGRDLGQVVGLDDPLGVTITDDPGVALAADPDIVFHSTVSSIEAARSQLETAMEAGTNVVSTSEELAYPWWSHPDVAAELDEIARENGVTCLGAGINPGFVMDTMPAVLSTPMESVESVSVERVQNAGERRRPLQEKVGAGLDVAAFESEIVEGGGHVGSPESVAMMADALGWELTDITESIEPVLAEEPVSTGAIDVEPGQVAGIHQMARGFVEEDVVISLDLQMYVGADPSYDQVTYEGSPPVSVRVENGYHGDVSTTAVVRNVAARVYKADAGLKSVLDLQVPSYRDC